MRNALQQFFRKIFGWHQRPHDANASISRAHIEHLLGFPIRDLSVYEQALRHRSLLRGSVNSHRTSNERLEFLGDAVLGFVVANYLYQQFPHQDEGFLTRLRARLVSGKALAQAARRIDLGMFVLMSENMANAQGRRNSTILADALEAIIGAIYLDLGVKEAEQFINRVILQDVNLNDLAKRNENYKSQLLEFAQARGWDQPDYEVIDETGPSHQKTFTVGVRVRNAIYGQGTASSKKKAEQIAANEALERLASEEAETSSEIA